MLLLALFTIASVCVFANYLCADRHGVGAPFGDREMVARGRPHRPRDSSRADGYSLAVC